MAEYQLWDVEAGSYIGKYADEQDALSTVKKLVDHFGPDYAESLSLGRIADDGRILAPLSGGELVARVNKQDNNPEERRPRFIGPSVRKVSENVGWAARSAAQKSVTVASRSISRYKGVAKELPSPPKRGKGTSNKKSN